MNNNILRDFYAFNRNKHAHALKLICKVGDFPQSSNKKEVKQYG
jgi:hypothetical protein